MTAKNNPLLQPSSLPHGAPVFTIAKTEDMVPAYEDALKDARREIDAIKNNPAPATFENTIEALEFAGKLRRRVVSVTSSLLSCALDDERKKVKTAMNAMGSAFDTEVALDETLFKRIKDVHDKKDSLPLTEVQKLLLEDTYKGYVRSGALLEDSKKQRFKEINARLSELASTYGNNTLDSYADYKKVVESEDDLAGVPQDTKDRYAEAAEAEGLSGKWLIRLQPPPIDLLEYCENRALREEISRANGSVAYRGKFDNSAVVKEIVELRHEMATMLGYDNFAAYVLEERMAQTPENVMTFLTRNEGVYRPAAEAYYQKVKDYAKKNDGVDDFKVWDFLFYSRKLKEETFQIDLDAARAYFSLDNVLDGLRQHAEKLFNVKMTEATAQYDVYHPDVKVYEVTRADNGELVGLFYADYYARPGAKNGGAWMNSLRQAGLEDGEWKHPFVSNTCNFPKPTKDTPALLTVDQVRTLYHEFGHGMHGLCGKGEYPSQTGTSVKWDFVELPSQLQENWVMQADVLATFARHYKTGEVIPADMVEKIKQMDNFDAGYVGLRQTFLGMLDMTWHTTDPKDIQSVEQLEDSVIAQHWLVPRAAGPMSVNFGHLFAGGYAAGYYSYKWAEVLEADVFELFLREGLYHRDSGDRLRDTIYTLGGTKDPNIVFEDMMGRGPDPDALFRREGLLPSVQKTAKPVVPPPSI